MLEKLKKIVITGMGAITPFGNGVDVLWESCVAGKSGIAPVTLFDTERFQYTRGGQAHGIAGRPGVDRATLLMQAAATEALASAGLERGKMADTRCAVVLATNFGGVSAGERLFGALKNESAVDPLDSSEYNMQTCADRMAELSGFEGPRMMLSLSCSSGTAAIYQAGELIRSGRADIVLVGGYDALSRFAWSGLCALHAMTKDEVRPFDKNRSGTIFSEGAGAVILERLNHARIRDASIFGEMLGGWSNNNAFHLTAPSKLGAGSAMVMKRALEESRTNPEEINHVDAHGTGTKHNDVTETQAIKTVFGNYAKSLSVTALKGMTGHLMGAAGIIEAIVSLQSMKKSVIVPTINFQTPDPDCDLDYVFTKAREAKLEKTLSNSAGIGGCNAAIVLGSGRELI